VGLRVLITNINLWPPSGTAVYTRDLALELHRQGHRPAVFSSTAGAVARELRDAGIEVTDRLGRLRERPDVIHGHHHAPTLEALRHWPTVPAIYVCHDHISPNDRTPIHRNIHRHLGVSRVCVQRLIREGVPPSRAELVLNFVDLARFSPRTALPERPRRALVFSNYAHPGSHLPAVIEACRQTGLELDVAGVGVGRIVERPEMLLREYDIVFAKGKAAMEAMAVGAAVVLCDFGGVGPMVTSSNFDDLRPLNFGFEALSDPLRGEPLAREIARYDAADAARVRDLLRSRAGLVPAVGNLVRIYEEVLGEGRLMQDGPAWRPDRWPIRRSLFLRLYWRWNAVSPDRRDRLKKVRGINVIGRGVTRLIG
jgi:glycosyl transferase family 4